MLINKSSRRSSHMPVMNKKLLRELKVEESNSESSQSLTNKDENPRKQRFAEDDEEEKDVSA